MRLFAKSVFFGALAGAMPVLPFSILMAAMSLPDVLKTGGNLFAFLWFLFAFLWFAALPLIITIPTCVDFLQMLLGDDFPLM